MPKTQEEVPYGGLPVVAQSREQAMTMHLTAADIASAFHEVFDQAVVFHGFADYMRDYDVVIYATADRA